MNDDELIDRLRQVLHDEASEVHAPPDAWERFQRRAAAGARPAPRPRPRRTWFVAAPVAALGLAAAIIALVVANNSGTSTSHTEVAASAPTTQASAPRAAAPATTAAASASAGAATLAPTARPVGGPVPAGFQPESVTFVSPNEGFVLGTAPCSSPPCTSVLRTVNGGGTWVGIPAPRTTNVNELRFANGFDGWAWGAVNGQAELWATHDGGATWHQVTVPGSADGHVYALEAANGSVYAAVFDGHDFRVASAPVHTDAFTLSGVGVPVGAGPVPTVQVVLQGQTGWLLEVDRTVIGGLRLVSGTWQTWAPPCVGTNGPATLAASSPTELVAACDQGVWGPASPMGERLWVSHDGGATFADVGAIPIEAQAVAAASPATIVVAGTGAVSASFDGGATWSTVLHPASGQEVSDLGFTTASQGVLVLHPPGQAGTLVMTNDGGHTWHGLVFS